MALEPSNGPTSFARAPGNVIGQGAYFKVGPTHHHLKLFAALVGKTSKARKGTSWDPVSEFFYEVDPEWVERRVVGGLSSGEGLIHAVRDPVSPETG